MSTFEGRPVALPGMRGEHPWKAGHGVDAEKENSVGTPSKRAACADAAKSPASNAKRRPLGFLGGSAAKQKPAKRARKSMGRRVSFAPEQRLEQTHFYEREAAPSPLPYKDLEAMAARVNGTEATEPQPQLEEQQQSGAANGAPAHAPQPASPVPNSPGVDMDLTGVSDYGAGEMSGPLPKFSAAKAGAAADGDATAQSAGTDITAAAASQWASYGFLGDDTGAVAPAAAAAPPAAAPALEHPHAAAEAAPAANAASPPAGLAAGTPAGAEEDAGADSVAALDAAFGAVAGGRRLSGSPDGSGSMAPGADTPTRDLTHNITAAMGGLSTLLEEDEEWLSGSRSRTTSPGCRLPGEDTTVHHRPASPGDGDVSMELTDVYATEMAPAQPAAEPQLAAEVQPPLADEAVLDVQAPAAAEADGSPATEAEQAAEAEAAPLAASPEPLLQFGDAAADAAQQAAAPADLLGSPLAAAAAPAEAVAAPPSVSQLQQEDEQLHAPAEPELQHAPAEPELQPQQLDMGDLAAAPAPADSQLAAGSPPPALHMGVPQILDSPQRPALSGSLQQEGFSQRLQDSPAGSSELPERLSLSPAQREQRSKWGCVPGADYTVDLDVAANARSMMQDRTFNEVYGAASDAEDSVTGPPAPPGAHGLLDSPLPLCSPEGLEGAMRANALPLADLVPGGDTPSGEGATSNWGGGRRDSVNSRRSSFGADVTGHLLDADVDLDALDFPGTSPGADHFPSPGVPAGADGNTGNLLALAPDFGGGGGGVGGGLAHLRQSMQRLHNAQQGSPTGRLLDMDVAEVPQQALNPTPQREDDGLGRTASTGGGGATAALLQATGQTHDLLATPQGGAATPATGRRTGGTTAHLLDFTAASANHLGGGHFRAHSPVAAPAAVARSPATGSLMDDDMQLTEMVEHAASSQGALLLRPEAARAASLQSGQDTPARRQPLQTAGQEASEEVLQQVRAPTPGSVASRRSAAASAPPPGTNLEMQAQEQSPYWVPHSARRSPMPAPGGSIFPGGDLLKRTPVRALQMQPQAAPATGTMAPPQAPRQPPARTAPEPSPSPARPQTRAPMLDMLQTPASAPRQGGIGGGHFVGQNLTDGCPPLMAIAFPTPPSAAPLGGRQGLSLMDADPAGGNRLDPFPPLENVANTTEFGAGGSRLARTPLGEQMVPTPSRFRPPATPLSVLRRVLAPRPGALGGNVALTRPLALAEICAKVDIQMHEHMRVPRPSIGGNLGIDPPPANLQEALAQKVREVDIGHAEESRGILEGVAARLRESLAAKDAAVLAAPPALVRDLQLAETLRAEPALFGRLVAVYPDAFSHELTAAEDGPVQLWAALHPLKADAAAAAPEAIAAAAASDLENVKEQCGNLWAMLKTGAQSTWKEWAGQRAAELTPFLVGLKAAMEGHWARMGELNERLAHEHAAAAAHAQRAAAELAARDARHQADTARRTKLGELRRQLSDATAANAERTARLAAARQTHDRLAAERSSAADARELATAKVSALSALGGEAIPDEERRARLAAEAEEAMEKWDLLDITCGLAGWRLASATPLDAGAPTAGCALTFRLAGGLARLTLVLRPPADGGAYEGSGGGRSCSVLEVDEAGVPTALHGLAAAALGPRLMGEQPLRDATRAGAARRLDAAAALAGRAADLLSEAAALRLKFPKLSQLRWTPAEGGEGLGRLRLGFLCLQSGARLHADLAVGPDFNSGPLDCRAQVALPGAARISSATVAEAAASAAPGANRLTRIAVALSDLVAAAPDGAAPPAAIEWPSWPAAAAGPTAAVMLISQQLPAVQQAPASPQADGAAAAVVDAPASVEAAADKGASAAAAESGADMEMVAAEELTAVSAADQLAEAAASSAATPAWPSVQAAGDEAAPPAASQMLEASAVAADADAQATPSSGLTPAAMDATAEADVAAAPPADGNTAVQAAPPPAVGNAAVQAAPPAADGETAAPAALPAGARGAAVDAASPVTADEATGLVVGNEKAPLQTGKTPYATMSVISNPLYSRRHRA